MRFTVCDIKCNNYNSHTLRNGVLNTINAYYDGFEYTLYRKLEETTLLNKHIISTICYNSSLFNTE